MSAFGYTLFDTAVGRCGVAWGGRGLVAVGLPEGHDAATCSRLVRHAAGAREERPPEQVRETIDGIVALADGEAVDFAGVELDLERVAPFHREVYAVARTIPVGATLTYGDIARRLGDVTASRAVGQALGANPWPIVVPCHRVVGSGGRLGGFSARGGTDTKLALLEIERPHADAGLTLF
jgi:methylated-DNA-[protein]-cysteine S-methyltransferase